MAKEIYKNGKLTDLVGAVISEQKKLEKASAQTRTISGHTSMVVDSSSTLSM
jgi:hypothetical protein